jgi:hypothetical protein
MLRNPKDESILPTALSVTLSLSPPCSKIELVAVVRLDCPLAALLKVSRCASARRAVGVGAGRYSKGCDAPSICTNGSNLQLPEIAKFLLLNMFAEFVL